MFYNACISNAKWKYTLNTPSDSWQEWISLILRGKKTTDVLVIVEKAVYFTQADLGTPPDIWIRKVLIPES